MSNKHLKDLINEMAGKSLINRLQYLNPRIDIFMKRIGLLRRLYSDQAFKKRNLKISCKKW